MAARIDTIIDAPGKPGRKIIEGEPLPEDHPVYQAYVGQPTPPSARVRNPVTYFDSTVGGWPCGCGCGEEIFAGEFVRGHEQTALHQRVAQIGTIPEFLRWFDAVRAGAEPAARAAAPAGVSRPGQFDLSIGEDGSVRIHFTPTAELALISDLGRSRKPQERKRTRSRVSREHGGVRPARRAVSAGGWCTVGGAAGYMNTNTARSATKGSPGIQRANSRS